MAKFIEVTHAETGNDLLINVDHITAIGPKHPEDPGEHQSCLMVNSGNEFKVSETVENVRRQIANPLMFGQ